MAYENVTHIDMSIGKSGTVLTTLTADDFEESSLTIRGTATSGSDFTIGGTCLKELTLTLTRSGMSKLDSHTLLRRKACLHPIIVYDSGETDDKGYFYITELKVYDYYAELVCYDGMVAFDEKIPESVLTEMRSSHTIEALYQLCVSNCSNRFYELSFDSSSIIVNKGVSLKLAEDSTIDTYRNCLEFLTAVAGGFCEVDTSGTLVVKYYGKMVKQGVEVEPDDVMDVYFDPFMSKVVVVKTSVGGFDYVVGSEESSDVNYDQLTVMLYENPFLRGFITEGEESKNPNVETIFNNSASTIIGYEMYGGYCAVPARGNISLGDVIKTTRGIVSEGSNTGIDLVAEKNIMVNDFTWSYQNQLMLNCNASVSNINPSSSGLNKGNVYKPVPGSGRDNRLDEIADRLEDESSKLFNSNVEMSFYDWATEGSKNELSVKDSRIVYYVNKLTVRRDTVKYLKIKNISVNVGIRSDIIIPDIDDSVVESVEEGVTSKEGYELIGRLISAGNWIVFNRDTEEIEISSGSDLYVSCVVKKSGEALSASDLSNAHSLIDNNTPPVQINYDDFIFLNSGRFLDGDYPESYRTVDFSNQLSLINDTVYASILKNSVDSLSEINTTNLNPDFNSDYLDIYVVVYGRPDIQSYENDILNYTPIVSTVGFCYKSPSASGDTGYYKINSPNNDWGSWNDIYKNMYMSLDISFEVDYVEPSSSLILARSLISYLSNKSTTDIIVDEISKNNYTASREYVMYLYRSLYDTINALTEYVLSISVGYTPSDEIESLKNEINSLSSSITDIEKEITKLENNDSTISSDISEIKSDILNLKDRVTKLEEGSGGVTPDTDPDPEPTPTTSSSTRIARYTNESEVVIDNSHSDVLSMQLEIEKDTNTMLSFAATGGMSLEGLLDFHVFYDNSEIAFNPKFFVSKTYETISFSTSFLPISRDKRVTLSITCTTSDASIIFPKDGISVSVINAELPKSDTEFNFAIPDVVIPSSIVSLRDLSDSVTTQ